MMRKVTLKDVAERTGIPYATITKWEKKKRDFYILSLVALENGTPPPNVLWLHDKEKVVSLSVAIPPKE